MSELLKLNPPIDLDEVPRPGTVTAVSSGAAALVPVEWLREINASGIQPGELEPLLDELAEMELLEEMVSFRKDATGIDHTIFISPRGQTRHAPRIKVAIDPPDSLNPAAVTASIAIHDGSVVAGSDVAPALLRQLQQFVEANRPVLLDYWDYRIDTRQLDRLLKKIPTAP
jgi:hypothetical protein